MTTRTPVQHGERRCYLRGCRLPECLDANYRYMSRLRLDYQRGTARRTDAKPVRAHINQLLDAGWTQAQIERATGVGHRTLSPLRMDNCANVHTTTARRLLALPIGPPPAGETDTDATGTIRRLQALAAIGHSYAAIARHVGIHKDALGVIARGDRTQVRVETAKIVTAVYRHMSRAAGSSARSRFNAARLGWHGPLAWDDTTIDDPSAKPEADEPQTLNRDQLAAIRRADVEHLDGFGVSVEEIARRLGMAESTVKGIVKELRAGERRDRSKAAA
ncbi:hypothetical protein [Streptomyces sp. SID2119]|uniref:hypothetical protein n=1 Tax=Streptomyces sp. SID2119 TaxID=2690253 RepID=UPI001370B4D9|nr:hypothetical protein [Streptomyces sp. SID2119]MYW29765.1 hypothetical protein [Streptomyces sp. SID2119]